MLLSTGTYGCMRFLFVEERKITFSSSSSSLPSSDESRTITSFGLGVDARIEGSGIA